MDIKELNSVSPLRVFEEAINGGLGRGNLGVIVSRHGLGKTACLVHLATDKLFKGESVIHVSFSGNVEHVINWYKEVFREISELQSLDDAAMVYNSILANRVVMNFSQDQVPVEKVLASLESDSDSYREMVRTSIAESTSVIEKLGKSEEEAEAEIGRFFFDRGGDWIDETTPQEALDSVEKMLLSANRTEELRKNLDKLERSAKRDEYNALIESEEGKIKVLEEDKARLDAEIEEMKAEIARLRREIDKLGGDDDL